MFYMPMSILVLLYAVIAQHPWESDNYNVDIFYYAGIPMSLYPLCNSLMTLLIIKPYRGFLFQLIRRFRTAFNRGGSSIQIDQEVS